MHEDVHQLMLDHLAELIEVAVAGDDHPAFEKFEKSSDPFRDMPGSDVGLLEVKVGAVEDQGNPAGDGEIEFAFQIGITLFREVGPPLGQVFHLRVVIDIEMLGFQYLPFEIGILNLVAPEVKPLRRQW